MNESITQEHNFGCGVACIAFVANLSYSKVVEIMGVFEAKSQGFSPKKMNMALEALNFAYTRNYLKPRLLPLIYRERVIVFIRRSELHPYGHYLAHYRGQWMDPWINLAENKDITAARSGYILELPGVPIYALFPE